MWGALAVTYRPYGIASSLCQHERAYPVELGLFFLCHFLTWPCISFLDCLVGTRHEKPVMVLCTDCMLAFLQLFSRALAAAVFYVLILKRAISSNQKRPSIVSGGTRTIMMLQQGKIFTMNVNAAKCREVISLMGTTRGAALLRRAPPVVHL